MANKLQIDLLNNLSQEDFHLLWDLQNLINTNKVFKETLMAFFGEYHDIDYWNYEKQEKLVRDLQYEIELVSNLVDEED